MTPADRNRYEAFYLRGLQERLAEIQDGRKNHARANVRQTLLIHATILEQLAGEPDEKLRTLINAAKTAALDLIRRR